MKINRTEAWYAGIFSFIIVLFLWPLFSLKSGFLHGDNYAQFYPWLAEYSKALKNGNFPFWIRSMQCGFPLMAEGQIGGLYPLHVLLFYLLPFKFAYNYTIILHFFLAGWFMYLYARLIGMSIHGAFVCVLLFCFGSCYAGCFYNIVTLRTLIWFPFVLWCFEKFFNKRTVYFVCLAGFILGIQLLAGFVQMAFYCIFFYGLYFVHRGIQDKVKYAHIVVSFLIFLVVSCIVALPQLLISYQLVLLSGRQAANYAFAIWGSFPPPAIISLVFPYPMLFLRTNFFIGIVALFFVFYAVLKNKMNKYSVVLVVMFLVSLFFAWGGYNPLYSYLLKATKMFSFRNPSKFLFFSSFALSVLAGFGFTQFFSHRNPQDANKSFKFFRVLLSVCVISFILAKIFFSYAQEFMIKFGYWCITHFSGTSQRYADLKYIDKTAEVVKNIGQGFALFNFFNIASFVVLIFSLFFLGKILTKAYSRKIILGIMIAELVIFNYCGNGFLGNIKDFQSIAPTHQTLLSYIQKDESLKRVIPFGLDSDALPNWIIPNASGLYGIDSIASYAPLASREYKTLTSGLGVIDDSLGIGISQEKELYAKLGLLKFLNVKYILSDRKLYNQEIEYVDSQNGVYLYRLSNSFPRFFFVQSLEGNDILSDASYTQKVIEYNNGILRAEVSTVHDGYFVFSEFSYPQWQAYVDGKKTEIYSFKNCIQAVKISGGRHEIVFKFKPFAVSLLARNKAHE